MSMTFASDAAASSTLARLGEDSRKNGGSTLVEWVLMRLLIARVRYIANLLVTQGSDAAVTSMRSSQHTLPHMYFTNRDETRLMSAAT